MIFDEAAPAASRFRLAPLGLDMAVAEPPVPRPDDPNIALYRRSHDPSRVLSPLPAAGAKTVGKPLTEPRFNIIRRRYEQYL